MKRFNVLVCPFENISLVVFLVGATLSIDDSQLASQFGVVFRKSIVFSRQSFTLWLDGVDIQ